MGQRLPGGGGCGSDYELQGSCSHGTGFLEASPVSLSHRNQDHLFYFALSLVAPYQGDTSHQGYNTGSSV